MTPFDPLVTMTFLTPNSIHFLTESSQSFSSLILMFKKASVSSLLTISQVTAFNDFGSRLIFGDETGIMTNGILCFDVKKQRKSIVSLGQFKSTTIHFAFLRILLFL